MTANSLLFRLFLLFFCCLPTLSWAQTTDSLNNEALDEINQDLVEDYIAAGDGEEEFDFNALYEDLTHYRQHPLDLNKINRSELESLRLLSDLQVNDFLNYRKNCGDFIAIQELQAIPSFSLEVINSILPYVKLGGGLDDFKVPLHKMLSQGDNELFLRWRRVLESQEGFLRNPTEYDNYFLGDRNKLYMRYRHRYSTRLSYGFTAEKDEGEPFFQGSNANGFDFYSAHLFLRDYNKVLKSVALGDFNASFGQGLILFSGFGSRKGAMVMNIKRHSRTLSSYRSVDENRFLRGAGITLGLAEGLETTIFASVRRRDANLVIFQLDTLTEESDEQIIASSLLGSGLHRTPSEIADEKDIRQRTLGASVKYATNQWHLAANALWEDLDRPLEPTNRPYNQFFFSGTRLFNASVDYSYLYRNYNFFGETAISDNGGFATTNGLLLGLDRNLDLSVLYRWFGRDYQALNPNPLAETRGARNEVGLYLGMEYRFAKNWRLAAYYDLYEHPWLRYQVDAPSRGVDYRMRLTYYRKRKLETYLEVRNETKQRNASEDVFNTNGLAEQQNFQIRLHLAQHISKTLRLSNRVDFGFARLGKERLNGFLAYQDIAWKALNWPISITSRLAIFDTDGYNIRFYHYENDLIYNFSIPAYYNRGSRFYVNFRYTGIRNLSLEARYARTHWSDQEDFGSGLNAIVGQNRSEVKAQLRLKF